MKNTLFISLLIALIVSSGCSHKTITGSSSLFYATATPGVNPLLKRMPSNPVMQLKIIIPQTAAPVSISNIKCMLNDEAVKNLAELQLYFTDTLSAFSNKNRLLSIAPAGNKLNISFDITLSPGTHYLWLGATVKDNANMDASIQINAESLETSRGKTIKITEQGSANNKRIGIAIRKAGDEGVNTYRIPGIAITDKGTLLAVYDIRYNNSGDLPGNIDVGMSRSEDGGVTWQPMKVIMDMGAPQENNGVGDPAILFDPVTKKIWVAALWSKGNRSIAGSEPGLSPDTTGQFVLVSSEDDGLSWSAPHSITSQVKDPKWHLYFNGPGAGIAMQNGTLVFASQYWDESKKPGIPHSSIVYSSDHGSTWKSGIGAKSNTTESQVSETTSGTLMLNMRDNRGKFRSVATTTDMGQTWNEHSTSQNALPDPVCMASFIKANVKVNGVLKDVLFFSNPDTSKGRTHITIKASLDLGETWQAPNQLLIDERPSFGYSALTKIDDNTVGLLYEGIRDLYFVRVPVREVIR